jgi:hypothetical protein
VQGAWIRFLDTGTFAFKQSTMAKTRPPTHPNSAARCTPARTDGLAGCAQGDGCISLFSSWGSMTQALETTLMLGCMPSPSMNAADHSCRPSGRFQKVKIPGGHVEQTWFSGVHGNVWHRDRDCRTPLTDCRCGAAPAPRPAPITRSAALIRYPPTSFFSFYASVMKSSRAPPPESISDLERGCDPADARSPPLLL